mgnify:CR=1 FL=1
MNELSNELLVVLLLLLGNGLLAMAEIALVSARKSRLRELAEDGDPKAAKAVAMAAAPTRFLSTVQVGITLVGVLAGALGGGVLTDQLAAAMVDLPWVGAVAHGVALGLVVTGITLVSVILGELLPKRIALQNPERVAVSLVGFVGALSRVISPVVSLLTDLALKPIGLGKAPPEAAVSDEEINILVEQGFSAGVFDESERDMVAGVLELDQLPVTAIMTPRPKMVFLNLADPDEANWRKVVTSGHSHFPVYQSNPEHVLGMVSVKAIWANQAFGLSTPLRNLLTPPLVVPETLMCNQLLEQFKKSGKHTALVADEFGTIQGITTLIDMLEAIVGDLPDPGQRAAPAAKKREDGSWLVDASLDIDEVKEMLELDDLPNEDDADFQTLGGFVMTFFGRIPAEGDRFDAEGWRFEVMDMDRHRIDKILVSKVPVASDAAEEQVAG